MLRSIIANKVQKSKQNIQTYLSNPQSVTSQPQPTAPKEQPTQSITATRPVQQASTFTNTASITQNKTKINKNEFQLKALTIQGKQYNKDTKDGLWLKLFKQDGRLQIYYQQQGFRQYLQTKKQHITGKRVQPNYAEGSCAFSIKSLIIKRQDLRQNSIKGNIVWQGGRQAYQQTVVVWLKEKEQLKALMESPFMEGLGDPNLNSIYVQPLPKQTQQPPAEEGIDGQEDHSNVKLSIPTPAQQAQSDRVRKIIKQMKQQEKVTVLFDVFKIKKQYDDPASAVKKLKCPIYYCEKKSYKDVQQLKNHIKIKHPYLSKHGIQLSDYDGTFEYGSKAIDLALFIGKMFPQEMKKIIKQMKTKPAD